MTGTPTSPPLPSDDGHLTVREFIDELLATVLDPHTTRVYLSASEVEEPCEFVALDEFVARLGRLA